MDGSSSVEQALIRPLAKRYPSNDPEKVTPIWNDDYANEMREVYRAHRDDHDVAALFAEAIMNRTPWQLWDIKTGKPADGADTAEAIAVLERAMAQPRGMQHSGLLHIYMHLMEMSPSSQKALRAADALRVAPETEKHGLRSAPPTPPFNSVIAQLDAAAPRHSFLGGREWSCWTSENDHYRK